MLNKIINRVESAKPHPVLFICWILLIATIRYYLEMVLISRFDTTKYVYHTFYYISIFLFIPTLLLYLITREDIDRIINVVSFLIFPFKLLSVIMDRLILGSMVPYHYLQGKPAFLLKYIFLLQGETVFISHALAAEWIIISVLIGLYATYKRKIWWLFPIFALLSHAIIVFSGAFVTSIILPPLPGLLTPFLYQKPLMHALIQVNTTIKNPFRFYCSLFVATSFILFLIYAIIYLKERRVVLFRRTWWMISALLIGPFITYQFYVYDAIIVSLALLAIFLFVGLIFYQKFLQGNEKTWAGIIFLGYSILLTIYTFRMDLHCIFGTLIGVGIVINLVAVLRSRFQKDSPPL